MPLEKRPALIDTDSYDGKFQVSNDMRWKTKKKKKRSSSKNQESLGEELHYYRYNSSISFLPPPTELAVCLGGASVPVSVA